MGRSLLVWKGDSSGAKAQHGQIPIVGIMNTTSQGLKCLAWSSSSTADHLVYLYHISYKYYNVQKCKEKNGTYKFHKYKQRWSLIFIYWYLVLLDSYIFSTFFCTDSPQQGCCISWCRYKYSTSRSPQQKHVILNNYC